MGALLNFLGCVILIILILAVMVAGFVGLCLLGFVLFKVGDKLAGRFDRWIEDKMRNY